MKIRLPTYIHRAQACGSPASAHEACLRKTVTELLLSGVGLEQDLAGHKYITALLNTDNTGGKKNEWDRGLEQCAAGVCKFGV